MLLSFLLSISRLFYNTKPNQFPMYWKLKHTWKCLQYKVFEKQWDYLENVTNATTHSSDPVYEELAGDRG